MSYKRRMIMDSNGYVYPPLHFRDAPPRTKAFANGVSTLADVDKLLDDYEDFVMSLPKYKGLVSAEVLRGYLQEFSKQREQDFISQAQDDFGTLTQRVLREDPSEALKDTSLGETGGYATIGYNADEGTALELYCEDGGVPSHGVVSVYAQEWLETYYSKYKPQRSPKRSYEEEEEEFINGGGYQPKYATTYEEEAKAGSYSDGADVVEQLLEEHGTDIVDIYIKKIYGITAFPLNRSGWYGNGKATIHTAFVGLDGVTCDALIVFDDDISDSVEIHGLSLEQGVRCGAINEYGTFVFNERSLIPIPLVKKCNALKAELDNARAELESAKSNARNRR